MVALFIKHKLKEITHININFFILKNNYSQGSKYFLDSFKIFYRSIIIVFNKFTRRQSKFIF